MGHYQNLRSLLQGVMPIEHQDNVYFNPQEGTKMDYPCIRYKLEDLDTKYANNKPYLIKKQYQVTVIDTKASDEVADGEMSIADKVAHLQFASFQTAFTKTGLYHTVYTLYY